MHRAAPLTDCTNATFQSMNRMPKTTATTTPKMVPRRHNPYECCLLAPEDSIDNSSSDLFGSPLTPGGFSSNYTDDAAYTAGTYRGLSQYSTPFITNGNGSSDSNTSNPATVRRSLFNGQSPDAGTGDAYSAALTPMKSSSSGVVRAASTVASGRDCLYAEIKVTLRSGLADFIVADIPTVFGASATANDMIGAYVLVEGDRGEDLGCVQSITSETTIAANKSGELLKKMQSERRMPCVLRRAMEAERQAFDELDEAEANALEYSRACLSEVKLDVPITIERAIFQFDRKKLTLQYTSSNYVDFNALTRHLHNYYKCRIWMDQLNREVRGNTADKKKSHRTARSSKSS